MADIGRQTQARVLGHEADHGENSMRDQSLNGQTVYGAALAADLARQNAAVARVNPHNLKFILFGETQ